MSKIHAITIYHANPHKLEIDMASVDMVSHGYRFTHGVSKTGITDTGTVVDFDTPQHTVYLYHGITGLHG